MLMPRKSKVITFSLPPEMAEQVRQVVNEDGRTMSEFLREAIRLYMDEREWLRRGAPPTGEGPPERTGMSNEEASMNQQTDYTPAALYQGLQRPAGRGPVRVRPAQGAQGLRT